MDHSSTAAIFICSLDGHRYGQRHQEDLETCGILHFSYRCRMVCTGKFDFHWRNLASSLTHQQSWSSLHWAGLMLADADINYNWLNWTRAKWYRHYPILFLAVGITLASPLTLLFNGNIYSFPFLGWENGIHPDPSTGRPLFELTKDLYSLYPAYNAPNLAVLTFSIGLQIVVELSKTVQWCLSAPFITFFHPHIMTVYRKYD